MSVCLTVRGSRNGPQQDGNKTEPPTGLIQTSLSVSLTCLITMEKKSVSIWKIVVDIADFPSVQLCLFVLRTTVGQGGGYLFACSLSNGLLSKSGGPFSASAGSEWFLAVVLISFLLWRVRGWVAFHVSSALRFLLAGRLQTLICCNGLGTTGFWERTFSSYLSFWVKRERCFVFP